MEHRNFGDTDLSCSVLGFGTWEMSTTQYGEIDVKAASEAVNAAIDRGITLFDTAEVYGPYHSEELLAKALGYYDGLMFDVDPDNENQVESRLEDFVASNPCLELVSRTAVSL